MVSKEYGTRESFIKACGFLKFRMVILYIIIPILIKLMIYEKKQDS